MGRLAAKKMVFFGAAILLVAVLGASGWSHYWHHTKSVADSALTSTQPSVSATLASFNQQPATHATKYLTVEEWGVSLPLPASIEKAYYVVPLGMAPDSDGKPSAIFVSDHSLDKSCGILTASGSGTSNGLGEIFRVNPTDIDTATAKPFTEAYPGGKTINGWYYGFKSNVGSAVTSDSATINTAN